MKFHYHQSPIPTECCTCLEAVGYFVEYIGSIMNGPQGTALEGAVGIDPVKTDTVRSTQACGY